MTLISGRQAPHFTSWNQHKSPHIDWHGLLSDLWFWKIWFSIPESWQNWFFYLRHQINVKWYLVGKFYFGYLLAEIAIWIKILNNILTSNWWNKFHEVLRSMMTSYLREVHQSAFWMYYAIWHKTNIKKDLKNAKNERLHNDLTETDQHSIVKFCKYSSSLS